jgi:uncharacterized protein YndB with AHSA1/START domain
MEQRRRILINCCGLVLSSPLFLLKNHMPAIKHLLTINASPETIYKALTTTEGIANWWTPETKIGNNIGEINIFNFGDKYHNEMKITKLISNKRVEWECLKGDREWIGTKLSFEIEEKNNQTGLRFTHDLWKEETDFFASCNFQWGYYMRSIKQYCETGKGIPFNPN